MGCFFFGGFIILTLTTYSVAEDWKTMGKDSLKQALNKKLNTNNAKNVILFIGDGMGMSTVTAARIYKGQKMNKTGEETVLKFEEFPDVALTKTYGADRQVTDSAATATALMGGIKTNYYIIGANDKSIRDNCTSIKGNEVPSILDLFQDDGRSTGIVTTTRVTHATPASAYAHTSNRDWEGDSKMVNVTGGCKDIAYQLVYNNNDIQVVMGGGRRFFIPNTMNDPETNSIDTSNQRRDGNDLISIWKDIQNSKGRRHKYVWNKGQFDAIDPANTDYVLGLFQSSHMQYELDRDSSASGEPSISEMTSKAIKILQKNKKGFFLLVEGGRIDHAHHDSFAKRALEETIQLELAVKEATRLTSMDDTLILVTADHSHVFNMGGYPYRGNDILGISHPNAEEPPLDGKPYTTLTYGNGPGYNLTGPRQDVTNVDLREFVIKIFGLNIRCQLHHTVMIINRKAQCLWETHSGEDVAIYAQGPMSHLIQGVQEQHYVAYVMQYATCLGEYKDNCRPKQDNQCVGAVGANRPEMFVLILMFVLKYMLLSSL